MTKTRWHAALGSAAGFALTAAALASSGFGDRAGAQALANHDSSAPVDFAADLIEVQQRADRVVVSGSVRVEQAGMVLNAARMTIAYTRAGGTEVNRIDATGGVTIRKGNETARGDVAIYDLDRRIITMLGNVELQQAGNRLSGGRLLIDLASGRASVDGRGGSSVAADGQPVTGTAPGGRVTGRFVVPKRN